MARLGTWGLGTTLPSFSPRYCPHLSACKPEGTLLSPQPPTARAAPLSGCGIFLGPHNRPVGRVGDDTTFWPSIAVVLKL